MVDAGRCDCRESVCWAEENGFTSVLLTPLDAARETEAETGIALTLLLASSTGSRVIALSFFVLQVAVK